MSRWCRTGCSRCVNAGRNNRDADDAVEGLVEGRADDDVGVLVHFLANAGGGFIDLEQRQVLAAGDRNKQTPRTAHRRIVDQRVCDRSFGGGHGAFLAGGFAGAHHGLAHLFHHRANVGEVEIDQAFLDHQIGDAGNARIEHLVGHRERIGEGGLLVGHTEQILVRNDQQRIDDLGEFGDADLGSLHAAHALEVERLGDDADGEDAHFARGRSDHGSSPSAGSAAHAGSHEHHVRARQMIADFVNDFLRRCRADVRLRTSTETLRNLRAHLNDALGLRHCQCLGVGIGDDKVDTLQSGRDHVVDGIAARATDTEHGDPRFQFANIGLLEVDCHGCLSLTRTR